jgi:iron complex outermembrane receptor protein
MCHVLYSDIQTNLSVGESHLLTTSVSIRYDKFDGGRYELTNYYDENSKYDSRSHITLGRWHSNFDWNR